MPGNKYSWRRKLTLEKASQIAETLRTDLTSTLNSAAARAGIPGTSVVQTISRYEREACTSEMDEQVGAILYEGYQAHLDAHRANAEVGALEGNGTLINWRKFRLETSAPKEHVRIAKQEVSGPDGGPVETVDLSAMPLAAVLALASGEGPSTEENN